MDARLPLSPYALNGEHSGMTEGMSFRIYLAGRYILLCHSQTSPTKGMWVQALLGIQEKYGYTKHSAMAR